MNRKKSINRNIQRLTRHLYKFLQRLITDIIKYLLRCFLEGVQDAGLIAGVRWCERVGEL